MIEKNATYMVMGLLNTDSIAFTIGQRIAARGGRVVYTVQNETLRKRFLKESEDAVLFLLGPHAAKTTGHVLKVDGGASIVGGDLMPFEKP